MKETEIQNKVINALVKKGFFIVRMIEGNNPEECIALMTKRKGASNFHAEVEADGSVNGESLKSYLASL